MCKILLSLQHDKLLKLIIMSKKFVIGDRTKDEYISVLDTEKKKLEFTNHIGSAKEFHGFEETKAILKKLQEEKTKTARHTALTSAT